MSDNISVDIDGIELELEVYQNTGRREYDQMNAGHKREVFCVDK